ncbi:MAG: hypothetical protein F4137_07855 [Acidobacteria bacterium]|nr:hypothetical protein [Acidobacteriota bacterium]
MRKPGCARQVTTVDELLDEHSDNTAVPNSIFTSPALAIAATAFSSCSSRTSSPWTAASVAFSRLPFT